jgi:2-polyprenyl-6-methoxyphenol hydroxylase-like FAD-dependent oxidoreductase
MATKTVLISGASVAGPSLAFWLNRYGFKTTIVERAPALRPGGYAVDFRGAGMEVLRRMNLIDEIRRHEVRTGKITIVDEDNKKVASMPDGFTSGELEIMRGDLANVLYDATKDDTEYIFNDSITDLTQGPHGVDVSFSRTAARRFDLVIGADGLHSNVRSLTFGEEAQFLHEFGLYVAIFTVPDFMNVNGDGLFYGTLGRRVGLFGVRQKKEAKASFYFSSEPLQYDRRDIQQQKRILHEKFAGLGWQVPQMLQYMDSAPDFYFDSISQIRMDTWSRGRVTLVGDAAHCASPMAGLGTTMAMIGAYVLAGELNAAHGDHTIAFPRYENLMHDFSVNIQKLADGAEWFVPNTPLRLWMSNIFWKILPYTPWKNMMIKMPTKLSNSITLKDYEQRESRSFAPVSAN